MSAKDVLKKILPCDTQKPYIFVSYSSKDKDLVWQDVLTYQQNGYNVWLDEKNLDKTKDSWKEDALLAIEDMYCMLLVFYVSKSSLISESCYNELAKTTDELTIALHYGPVKFIAIDVDEVGNIGDFTRDLHQSVFADETKSKSEKSKRLLTLHHFMKNFFDSNNEKVRIHPKNEKNRKMNYYEEILASFPDVACNLKVKAEQEEKKKEDKKEDKKESSVAGKKAAFGAGLKSTFAKSNRKEEVETMKQKLEKVKQEVAKLQKNEKKGKLSLGKADPENTEEVTEKPEMREDEMGNPEITEEVMEAFEMIKEAEENRDTGSESGEEKLAEEKMPEGEAIESTETAPFTFEELTTAVEAANQGLRESEYFRPAAEIKEKSLRNAVKSYASHLTIDQILWMKDNTFLDSGKDGFLITIDCLYYRFNQLAIRFNDLAGCEKRTEKHHLYLTYKDGKEEKVYVSIFVNQIKAFLDSLLSMR